MDILKEDGSLDIERINDLPEKEYMEVIGSLSEEKFDEYLSGLPVNDSTKPFQPNRVDCSMEEYVKKYHLVNASDVIKSIVK